MRCLVVGLLCGCSSVLGIEDFTVSDAGGSDSSHGLCLGPGDWQICLPDEPTAPRAFTSTLPLSTSDAEICREVQPAGWTERHQPACFVVASDITISAELRAQGTRPLVLFASKTITLTQPIDVSGVRGKLRPAGVDLTANDSICGDLTLASGQAHGGAGGSFMFKGGDGGKASTLGGFIGRAAEPDVNKPSALRGGCPGGAGAIGTSGGGGGGAGGAVYLVAGESIMINGTYINASGGAGGGGQTSGGGGGGGSGGMIVLHAPTIGGVGGMLVANGGGGGGGGSTGAGGLPGEEVAAEMPDTSAQGGGASGTGGGGGRGYARVRTASSGVDAAVGGAAGAGGGGGGGGGFILAPTNSLTTSPAATSFP